MKRTLLLFICMVGASAAEKKPATIHQAVFTVSGLECGSCLYMAQHALSQAKGVKEVEMVQTFSDFALVSYDITAVSVQQMVQTLREAPGLHGQPYIASMRLRIPGYNTEGTAIKVKALAKRWQQWIDFVDFDERENEVQIQFHELEKDANGNYPKGWTLEEFKIALKKELGLECEVVKPVS